MKGESMLLNLDFSSSIPIYMQIRNYVVMAIANGEIANGEKLPPIRALADEIGVNMMTVSKAYQLLKREGYISTDRRNGATISYRTDKVAYSQESLDELKLKIAELKLAGMSEVELINLCKKFYEED